MNLLVFRTLTPWMRLLFLMTALLATSGYRWRCYLACVDQTSTQNDYVEQRDYCREYAQLKIGMASRDGTVSGDDKSRKASLVSLFSQCMGNNGWTVPDGKGDAPKAAAAAVAPGAPPPPSAAVLAAQKAEDKANTTRAVECAFARHSADVSTNAKLRADACDLECSEALRLSPNAPRPPSCPDAFPTKLSKGSEQ